MMIYDCIDTFDIVHMFVHIAFFLYKEVYLCIEIGIVLHHGSQD